ncbi:glutaminyl-tRNA synthase (glutamine-hydrolyzing) subunit B [Candidatus Jorgensenbacteria bacterium RIFCSPLOWO2_02_FULL_45_12]|nr:MAG: glutaminyl-tRNA synthase (glutamine-hydrolyzing) subunit B [Candidatus Jorgensenbacteria bacterium RIFCSPLOWO2_02_FULL_45_12]
MNYIPVIGLEIHAELKTKSKMFCSCLNDPDETRPNINVCPVCLGHPGTLPTANEEAVKSILRFGAAIGGVIARKSHFDRKSYFYPDLPKGYQISQYNEPLVSSGMVAGVAVRRVHLEEDTGTLGHDERITSSGASERVSLVNFNRAGVPLMEIVTEPSIRTAAHALEFAKELRVILRYLRISDADMEKGQMRVEVNISVRREDTEEMGTKVEIKNINSFKAAADAVLYEIKRQTEIIGKGEKVIQETRGWNEARRATVSQRTKESAHDYRYFPEPDLIPLVFSAEYIDEIKSTLPELPKEKRARFIKEFKLSESQAKELADEISLADFFEQAASELANKTTAPDFQLLFNYLSTDFKGILKSEKKEINELKVPPEHFAHLILLLQQKISSRMAKDLLLKMHDSGEDPETILNQEGLEFMDDDDALLRVVHKVLGENGSAVSDYKKGQSNALRFLVGRAMAETKGQGNPQKLRALFEKHIGN